MDMNERAVSLQRLVLNAEWLREQVAAAGRRGARVHCCGQEQQNPAIRTEAEGITPYGPSFFLPRPIGRIAWQRKRQPPGAP